jgi:myotubularin-related protein 9
MVIEKKGNCQKEREQLFLSTRTVSLWTYVNSPDNLKNFLNPLYKINKAAIWPSNYAQCITLWSSLYLRFQKSNGPAKEVKEEINKIVEANRLARERVERLRKLVAIKILLFSTYL